MKNKLIAVLVVITLCFTACTSRHSNKSLVNAFLIPSNYEGILRIVYEDDFNAKPIVENDSAFFQFPQNGIMILNKDFNLNGQKKVFFLVDASGNRTKVNEIVNNGDRLNKMPAILLGQMTVAGFTYHNSDVAIKGLVYSDLYLYNKDTVQIGAPSPKFDTLTYAVANAFRAGKK